MPQVFDRYPLEPAPDNPAATPGTESSQGEVNAGLNNVNWVTPATLAMADTVAHPADVQAEASFRTTADTSEAATRAAADNALQTAMTFLAPLASPVLTGVPTAPTAAPGTNTAQIATAAFVSAAVAALIGGATPQTLDTLNQLASALGDNPNFATTVTSLIAAKLAIGNNLADLASAAAARANLGLGSAATLNVGNTAGTVAPGTALLSVPVGATVSVDASNGNNSTAARGNIVKPFATITAAMAAAQANDTINVAPGTYNEPVGQIAVNVAGLTINAYGAKMVAASAADNIKFGINAARFTLRGLEIAGGFVTGAAQPDNGCIEISASDSTFEGVYIHDFGTYGLRFVQHWDRMHVQNSRFENCQIGLFMTTYGSSNIQGGYIAGNRMWNNRTRGIALNNNTNGTYSVSGIITTGNTVGGDALNTGMLGIEFAGGNITGLPQAPIQDCIFTNNIVSDGSYGISINANLRARVSGNTVTGCSYLGIEFANSYGCTASDNSIDGTVGCAGYGVSMNGSDTRNPMDLHLSGGRITNVNSSAGGVGVYNARGIHLDNLWVEGQAVSYIFQFVDDVTMDNCQSRIHVPTAGGQQSVGVFCQVADGQTYSGMHIRGCQFYHPDSIANPAGPIAFITTGTCSFNDVLIDGNYTDLTYSPAGFVQVSGALTINNPVLKNNYPVGAGGYGFNDNGSEMLDNLTVLDTANFQGQVNSKSLSITGLGSFVALSMSNGVDSTLAMTVFGGGQVRIGTDFAGRWLSLASDNGVDTLTVRGGGVAIGSTTSPGAGNLSVAGNISATTFNGSPLGSAAFTAASAYVSYSEQLWDGTANVTVLPSTTLLTLMASALSANRKVTLPTSGTAGQMIQIFVPAASGTSYNVFVGPSSLNFSFPFPVANSGARLYTFMYENGAWEVDQSFVRNYIDEPTFPFVTTNSLDFYGTSPVIANMGAVQLQDNYRGAFGGNNAFAGLALSNGYLVPTAFAAGQSLRLNAGGTAFEAYTGTPATQPSVSTGNGTPTQITAGSSSYQYGNGGDISLQGGNGGVTGGGGNIDLLPGLSGAGSGVVGSVNVGGSVVPTVTTATLGSTVKPFKSGYFSGALTAGAGVILTASALPSSGTPGQFWSDGHHAYCWVDQGSGTYAWKTLDN